MLISAPGKPPEMHAPSTHLSDDGETWLCGQMVGTCGYCLTHVVRSFIGENTFFWGQGTTSVYDFFHKHIATIHNIPFVPSFFFLHLTRYILVTTDVEQKTVGRQCTSVKLHKAASATLRRQVKWKRFFLKKHVLTVPHLSCTYFPLCMSHEKTNDGRATGE